MKQQDLSDRDVFWLWWAISPQLASHDEVCHSDNHEKLKVVSMAKVSHGSYTAQEDFSGEGEQNSSVSEKTDTDQDPISDASTEVRHYHIQRGHWYNSISMILLIALIIILIPIAVVIAFSVVISLFVNQSLFTMMAGF